MRRRRRSLKLWLNPPSDSSTDPFQIPSQSTKYAGIESKAELGGGNPPPEFLSNSEAVGELEQARTLPPEVPGTPPRQELP